MTIIYSHKPLKDRVPADFYPTPIELSDAALDLLDRDDFVSCIDVGAGDGVWGESFRKRFGVMPILTGIDIRDDAKGNTLNGIYDKWIVDDYLNHNEKYNLIFGNPPFRFANDIVKHSLDLLEQGGVLLFLLRSAFSESKKRYEIFYSVGLNPKYEYQSVRRISFTGNKKSDNTAYSIFIWEKGWKGETIKRWLDWEYAE